MLTDDPPLRAWWDYWGGGVVLPESGSRKGHREGKNQRPPGLFGRRLFSLFHPCRSSIVATSLSFDLRNSSAGWAQFLMRLIRNELWIPSHPGRVALETMLPG